MKLRLQKDSVRIAGLAIRSFTYKTVFWDVRWTLVLPEKWRLHQDFLQATTIPSVIRVPEQSIVDISKPVDTARYNMEPHFTSRILHSQQRETVLWKSFYIFLPSILLSSCPN